jgi:Outer membrane protein beta-barrel domain
MTMRPWVLLVTLGILGLGVPCVRAEKMMVGVEGGLSLANLRGGDVYNNSIKYGAIGGVFGRHALTGIFAIQPEVLFAMKGAKYEADGIKSQQEINYIEIPVLVRATMRKEGKLKPSLFAGPAIGILLSNKITNGEEIDIKDASNGSDFGLVFGAGADYMLEKGCVLLDARYELGLTSTMKSAQDKEIKNSVISIMIGYGMQF